MSLRLAVATEDFDASLKKAIGLAGTTEVSGLRLNSRSDVPADSATASSIRQILLYVKEHQMSVAGLTCPTRHALYAPDYLEPRLEIIRQSMSLARKLETSELLVRCGRIPDPDAESATQTPVSIDDKANPFTFSRDTVETPSPASEFSLLCEILNELTQHGNHVGCVLQLQLSTYSPPGLIKRLLSEITAGPLQFVFDPATAIMTGSDPTTTFRDFYQNIGYVRARDALKDIDGAGVEVGVGDGNVDWTQLLPTLYEADYQSWLCVERTGGDNRAEDVRRGVSHLKALIPQTGD